MDGKQGSATASEALPERVPAVRPSLSSPRAPSILLAILYIAIKDPISMPNADIVALIAIINSEVMYTVSYLEGQLDLLYLFYPNKLDAI